MSPVWEDAAMAMMEQAPGQVAVKASPEGGRLITSGAHYLHMTKKELVEAAVAFYLDAPHRGGNRQPDRRRRRGHARHEGNRGPRLRRGCLRRPELPGRPARPSLDRSTPR